MTEKILDKEQIYIICDPKYTPNKGLSLATMLANAHNKKVCFLTIIQKRDNAEEISQQLFSWCQTFQSNVTEGVNFHLLNAEDDFTDFMEENEAAAVIFEIAEESIYRHPKKALTLCRELRIPYYFIKPDQDVNFQKVLVPIGFLVEEREKGVFCSGMGRIFHSELMLMIANDYGSRAKENAKSIQSVLDKFQLNYKYVEAKKDSFKVEIEAMNKAEELNAGLLLISASRDYGLDDIIFGPKEQKVIQKSTIPVMVINPRKDLYALCS